MKNPRTFLWIGLALILVVNVQVWMAEFGPRDAALAEAQRLAMEQERRDNPLSGEVPEAAGEGAPAREGVPVATPAAPAAANDEVPVAAAPATPAADAVPASATPRIINVRT